MKTIFESYSGIPVIIFATVAAVLVTVELLLTQGELLHLQHGHRRYLHGATVLFTLLCGALVLGRFYFIR